MAAGGAAVITLVGGASLGGEEDSGGGSGGSSSSGSSNTGSGSSSTPTAKVGVLLGSVVEGFSYTTTSGASGTINQSGEFSNRIGIRSPLLSAGLSLVKLMVQPVSLQWNLLEPMTQLTVE